MENKLIVLSATSGGGKDTIAKLMLTKSNKVKKTVSSTTRVPRENEKDKQDYYFIDQKLFKEKIKKDEFLEWAEVHNNFYGTLKEEVMCILGENKIPLLTIDVKGGINIKKIFPNSTLIFLKPVSFEILEKRIRNRALITDEEVKMRLETAKKEIEMAKYYDYIVENPEGYPEKAAEEILKILIPSK